MAQSPAIAPRSPAIYRAMQIAGQFQKHDSADFARDLNLCMNVLGCEWTNVLTSLLITSAISNGMLKVVARGNNPGSFASVEFISTLNLAFNFVPGACLFLVYFMHWVLYK